MERLLPSLASFALAIVVLLPSALTEPQFVDEQFYAWGGHYIWDHLVRLDFDPLPEPDVRGPGWNP